MRPLIAAAVLLALAACASEPPPTVAASAAAPAASSASAASAPKMVCHAQQVTGSHFTQNVCEPEGQDNSLATERDRAWLEQRRRPAPTGNTSGTSGTH